MKIICLKKFWLVFILLFLSANSVLGTSPKPERIIMNDETAYDPEIQALLIPGKNGYILNIHDSLYDIPLCSDFLDVLNNMSNEDLLSQKREYDFGDSDFRYLKGRKPTWHEISSFSKKFYMKNNFKPKELKNDIEMGRLEFEISISPFWHGLGSYEVMVVKNPPSTCYNCEEASFKEPYDNWASFSLSEKNNYKNKYGFSEGLYIKVNDDWFFLIHGRLVTYKNEVMVLYQDELLYELDVDEGDGNDVSVSVIKVCGYWKG